MFYKFLMRNYFFNKQTQPLRHKVDSSMNAMKPLFTLKGLHCSIIYINSKCHAQPLPTLNPYTLISTPLGEVLGALCQQDGGATYAACCGNVLELVRSNLERQVTDDEASRSEHESTRLLMEKLSAGTRERVSSGGGLRLE